jgi:hypothetical protein
MIFGSAAFLLCTDFEPNWDGGSVLFDLNFGAFGISPRECFELAREGGRELRPGKFIKVYFAQPWGEE